MQAENWGRLQTLCEQAAVEEDSERLIKLIEEINCLLEEREQRTLRNHVPVPGAPQLRL